MPASQSLLKMFIAELDSHIQKWEACCLRLSKRESVDADLRELFRFAHNLKAGAQIVDLEATGKLLHRLEDYLSELKNGKRPFTDEALDLFNDTAVYLKQCLSMLRAGENRALDSQTIDTRILAMLQGPMAPAEAVPDTDKLQALVDAVIHQERSTAATVTSANISAGPTASAQRSQLEDITTTVRLGQLDHLIRLIGELSIENDMLGTGIALLPQETQLQQSWGRSRKVLKDLQNTALELRMQTLEGLFMKFEKAAFDTARKLGKKVVVEKIGLEVELDKQIIEKISEPLIHMIRNAIDHGIEAGTDRTAVNKSEVGSLTLSAHDAGGTVHIVIEDDGHGIDAERVFQKAIEKGLVRKDATLSEGDKRQLIFLPGFSTAEAVTELSGRGVGLDVVKTLMDGLGGEIEIESEVGFGTRFILKIPATVSILSALVVNVEGINYAVPTQDLREIVDLADHEIKFSSQDKPFFVLRDNVVPLRRITEFLKVGSAAKTNEKTISRRPALVVKSGDSIVGFPVESISSQQRIHIRPMHESLQGINGAIGTAILAGGEASLILNLPSIVRRISLGA